MMKKFFEQEIRYGVNSKLYYSMTVFLIVLFGVTLFLNYSSVMDTYNDYQSTIDYYEKNDLDIEADLKSGYEIEENQKGGMIKNPIAYHKENVGRYLYAASPNYTLSQLFESSILYFPVVFGILGLLIATNDYKYKTIKLKTVRMNKFTFGLNKQLSIAVSSFFILLFGLIAAFIAGWVMYSILSNKIPTDEFQFAGSLTEASIIMKFLFAYILAVIFAELGYTLGILFKNVYAGMIAIIVYIFILPNLGLFDLKNAIYYFANHVFEFYGVVSIEAPIQSTNGIIAGLTILSVLLIALFTNILVIKKRSSFET
jgi:hypothetical protein